jgi:peptidyl-prolyl cis-trans isomerase A (cyclophilin A)
MPFPMPRSLTIALAFLISAAVACSPRSDSGGGEAASADPAAPDSFDVRFETSRGPFVVRAYRSWAPHGVDRFHRLVRDGYYDENRIFRVISGFMAQFGLHGDPRLNAEWRDREIPDDPVRETNRRGAVSFASRGPNTRTTQLFINLVDNANLDGMGFSPIGVVIDGMAVVDSLHAGYGEGFPDGSGPDQMRLMAEGNRYLTASFPQLDFIRTARVVE